MKKELTPITPETLSYALQHLRSLILVDEQVFDDLGNLKTTLHELKIVFDEKEHGPSLEALRNELRLLKQLVYKDELTGILNRRGVHEEFSGFFREALFYKEHKDLRKGVVISDFSVIFIDLDNFKSINDRFGHDEGDRVLKECAVILKKHARETDAVGRLGGEEFVMGLLGASESEAYEKAEALRADLGKGIRVGGNPITASLGVASLHASNVQTLEALIHAADMAMYDAKTNRGKNTTTKYSDVVSSKK
ncbi:MAG: hypothetical protein AMXMBFR44_4850 [Candidatus Campbellbacteria bacterium]